MKKVKNFIVGLVLLCVLTSCSTQANTDSSHQQAFDEETFTDTSHQQSSVGETFGEEESSLYDEWFDSEEQFVNVIQEVKQKRKEKDDQLISFETKSRQTTLYSAMTDDADLDSLSEYYRPIRPPKDTEIRRVTADEFSIAFIYTNEEDTSYGAFVWFRTPMTEEHMYGMLGRGAISEETKEYNGIKYLILLFPTDEEGESAYSIWWFQDDQAFHTVLYSDFTEEEALDFCQFETVAIKEK